MPCRINVIEEDGKIKIGSMRPSVMSQFFPKVDPNEAAAVENDVIEIIDSAK